MRKIVSALLIVSGALGATAATAQDWSPYARPTYNYAPRWGGSGDDICSGRRAQMLERWVDNKAREGRIDPDRADRFHAQIDRLDDRSRYECAERDWRAIDRISQRYGSIAGALRAVDRQRW